MRKYAISFIIGMIILHLAIGTISAATVPAAAIMLDNTQNTAASSGFQQLIIFNAVSYATYENYDLGNIRFYQGGTELYSWCESGCTNNSIDATFWVRLPNGIQAGSNTTITMEFESFGTNYDGDYAGEAPELSGTYGQYDNGAKVFNFYDNFAGDSLNSTKWNYGGANGGCGGGNEPAVDDGLTTNELGISSNLATAYANSPIFEIYGASQSSGCGENDFEWKNTANNYPAVGSSRLDIGSNIYWVYTYIGYYPCYECGDIPVTKNINYLYSLWVNPDTSISTVYPVSGDGIQYSSGETVSTPYGTSSLGNVGAVGIGGSWIISWARIRQYPPNGVMPGVSFGNETKTKITTTTVKCSPNSFAVGGATTCTAVSKGEHNPTGTIIFTDKSLGSFSGETCSTSSKTDTCDVTFTSSSAGTDTINATYLGDSNNTGSTGSATIKIEQSKTETVVTCTSNTLLTNTLIACTATVSGAEGNTTGDTVTWAYGKPGKAAVSFTSNTCTLEPNHLGGTGNSCEVSLTGLSTGNTKITASYGGDINNGGSSGTQSITIGNTCDAFSQCYTYHQQTIEIFSQASSNMTYTVNAVPQAGLSEPEGEVAYLLNGGTNEGYWYQVGVGYNWCLGLFSFQMVYQVMYNNVPVYPSSTSGGCANLWAVSNGDKIQLHLYFDNGNVIMNATDLNTGASASESYSAFGANVFLGGDNTGLMTEQVYSLPSPAYVPEQLNAYTDSSNSNSTEADMEMDERNMSNGGQTSWYSSGSPFLYPFTNDSFQSFVCENAPCAGIVVAKLNQSELITGDFGNT